MLNEKNTCPYAAIQTLGSLTFFQSGVNSVFKPKEAPSKVPPLLL